MPVYMGLLYFANSKIRRWRLRRLSRVCGANLKIRRWLMPIYLSLLCKLENSAVVHIPLYREFALQTRKFGGGIYAAEFLETYRSGHNGAHSKCVWRATATWVRIPPSPLNTSIKKQRKVQNEVIPQKHFYAVFLYQSKNINTASYRLQLISVGFRPHYALAPRSLSKRYSACLSSPKSSILSTSS